MRAVKSKGGKQDLGLTVQKATREARTIVDKIMRGVNATVESKQTAEVSTLIPVISTTVTFPRMHESISDLREELCTLTGLRDMRTECSSITFTRTVK